MRITCKSVRLTVIMVVVIVVAWQLDILTSHDTTNLLLGIFIFEKFYLYTNNINRLFMHEN